MSDHEFRASRRRIPFRRRGLCRAGRRDPTSVFRDADTGVPFARDVGGSLVFDPAAMASIDAAGAEAQAKPLTQTDADTDEQPKLCPDPGPDTPHGASAQAIPYQAQVSALDNPQRPLPPGLAVSLPNPLGGRPVYYDDCRESDGTMIEAKGPGYARFLNSVYMTKVLEYRWLRQALSQVSAAQGRNNDWFFAEDRAASFAAGLFAKGSTTSHVSLHFVPAYAQ